MKEKENKLKKYLIGTLIAANLFYIANSAFKRSYKTVDYVKNPEIIFSYICRRREIGGIEKIIGTDILGSWDGKKTKVIANLEKDVKPFALIQRTGKKYRIMFHIHKGSELPKPQYTGSAGALYYKVFQKMESKY